PPAMVSFSEPVSQGLLVPRTRIVLIHTRSQQPSRAPKGLPSPSSRLLRQVAEDDAEDNSNEQFYSAAEDKPQESSTDMESPSPPDESDTEASTQNSSEGSDDPDDSDESLED